jgi:hypothetical protein
MMTAIDGCFMTIWLLVCVAFGSSLMEVLIWIVDSLASERRIA